MSYKGWLETTWGDIAELRYGKGLKGYKENKKGVPVYGTNGQIGYTNEPLCKGPGVIIGRKGAYRGVHYSSTDFYVIDTAYYLVPKNKNIDLKWAYYELLTKDINSLDSGSAIPSTKKEDFYALKVRVPPLNIQKRISKFLGTIDDKIELNNQIISNLEQLAQTLFKRWFIDFEFPNENGEPYRSSGGRMVESELGTIPEGWEVKALDDIASYQNGLAMQKYKPMDNQDSLPVLKIRELNLGFTDEKSDRCSMAIKKSVKVYDGDVIFSWSGTLLVKLWFGGQAGLNQHLFKVTSEEFPKWFYYYWTKHHLNEFISIAKDKATTMGHIKRTDLSNAKVIIPDNERLNFFDKHLSPLINMIVELGLEINKLKNLRGALLPKLLSGEIEIPDEIEVMDNVMV